MWGRWGCRAAAFAAFLVASNAAAGVDGARPLVVGYGSESALGAALGRHDATIVRRLSRLHAVEVMSGDVAGLRRERGIRFVEPSRARRSSDEPALAPGTLPGAVPYEWQYAATHADLVPVWVQRAAAGVTIAVVDTGADLTVPDLAAKAPFGHSVVSRETGAVPDDVGHGTFVSSLAAGSTTNGEGIAGFGGDAELMIVKANRSARIFDDVDEANAIVWAVDHGARVVNLSLGGPQSSTVERRAIEYAVGKGALVVAAAGNRHSAGDPPEYPAALLQPVDSNGSPGPGLSVGASEPGGGRAEFSNAGSTISLLAPGQNVLGAVSARSPLDFRQIALPGSHAGLYGYGSGTSYSAPQVAGAAALVWAANPMLTAAEVAAILCRSATGAGVWNADTAYGVLDVAKAVELAGGGTPRPVVRLTARRTGKRVLLDWTAEGAASYRLRVAVDASAPRIVSTGTSTSTSYRLTAGRLYAFAVEALDESGRVASTSASYRVSLARPEPRR